MATKTNLITALNGFITAVVSITKHRNANNAIVDEIYPTAVTDTQITETYTTKSGTSLTYSITIIKSGNIAHLKINVRNSTASALGDVSVFSWKNSEFKPKSVVNSIKFKAYYDTNNINEITLLLDENGIHLKGAINPGSFSFVSDFKTYITQD